jgi:hypothetical protein
MMRAEDEGAEPVCMGCGDSFTVEFGDENDGWCHPCAHSRIDDLERAMHDIDVRLHATHETNLPRGYTCTCLACIHPDVVGWIVDAIRRHVSA